MSQTLKEEGMRARTMFAALMVGLTLALTACPGGGTGPTPPPSPPSPPSPPITTDFGTPVGSPVEGTMDATGGSLSEPTAAVTVRAIPGVYDSSAQVSVQPITNTLPGGIGLGAAIASSQALKKPLIVRFAYGADEPDRASLGIALQREDGSWVSLYPIVVNTANKTIAAALPDSLPAAGAPIKPTALDVRRVVRYQAFYIKPASATLKVDESVRFVPWARVVENECAVVGSIVRPLSDPVEDDLPALPPCRRAVVRDYPFTNTKPGFVRTWEVVGSGNGTVQPLSPAGATYTAPATAPSPNTVDVRFTSSFSDVNRPPVVLVAKVTIGGGDGWSGTFKQTYSTFTIDGRVEWELYQSDGFTDRYRPGGGSMTYQYTGPGKNCTVTPNTQPLTADDGGIIIDRTTEPPTVSVAVGKGWNATFNCGEGPFEVGVGGSVSGRVSLSADGKTIAQSENGSGSFNFTRK
jgi:hypothetical protein